MKRKLRLLFPLLLCTLPVSGCSFISIKDADEEEDTAIIDGFYKDYDLTLKGPDLIEELQRVCFDKHTNWITYEQTWSYYSKTSKRNSVDAISDGSNLNQQFYTCAEKTATDSTGKRNFTREHVWPCANSKGLWVHDNPGAGKFSPHYVDYSYYVGAGSDLLHLRPATSSVNTARGNSNFCSFSDPEYSTYTSLSQATESGGKYALKLYGNESFASRSEPDNHVKGDIARIILYVYVHYQERDCTPDKSVVSGNKTYRYSDMTGNLALRDVMGYETEERCQEVLMAWNKMDPVSEVEKLRNQTVQGIQGNRNPFVDYPDLVDAMFY